MGRASARFLGCKGVVLTLAILALAIKVIVPQGFMIANGGDGPSLVICTGHGPLTLAGDRDGKAPVQKKADAPCAFAGTMTPPPPADAAILSQPFGYGSALLTGGPFADLIPGRGLAAPPPRSHAPPAVLI